MARMARKKTEEEKKSVYDNQKARFLRLEI